MAVTYPVGTKVCVVVPTIGTNGLIVFSLIFARVTAVCILELVHHWTLVFYITLTYFI